MSYLVATFYKFVRLTDYGEKREAIEAYCRSRDIKGTILLAGEGINATIAGEKEKIIDVLSFIRADERFGDIEHKESTCAEIPFKRLKVRLKKEIVTLGQPSADPDKIVGTYVNAGEWNRLLEDPEVTVIDTRNTYEVEIGTFEGAIDPRTRHFREFPEYVETHLDREKHKKIALFCTGGIRCEKATSYLLNRGFDRVYHLKGGILKYLEEIPPEENRWRGECFVFDERVAVDRELKTGHYGMCKACGHPIDKENNSPVSCPHCRTIRR